MEWFTTDNLKVFEESIRADNPERMCATTHFMLRGTGKKERDLSMRPSALVEMTIGLPSAAVEMTRVKLVGMTRGKLVGVTKAANDGDVRWVRPETLRVSFRASKTSREISEIYPLKANAFQSK